MNQIEATAQFVICRLAHFEGFQKLHKNMHNFFDNASIISSLKQNMFIMFRLTSGSIFANIDTLVKKLQPNNA